MNQHSGQGSPDYGKAQGADALWVLEMPFMVQRGFTQLILGGVFERFPGLRFILTESGCAWAKPLLRRMDGVHMGMKMGMMGEVDYSGSQALKEPPSFYAKRNCWYGASFPHPTDVAGRVLALTLTWASAAVIARRESPRTCCSNRSTKTKNQYKS